MMPLRRFCFALAILLLGFFSVQCSAQQLAKRLILKDGSYQLATEWQVKGQRVRYLSAERGEWEEVPNFLVDWAATDKFAKERASGASAFGTTDMEKEYEAERKAEEARTPQVAPGLRLSDDNPVFLLETYNNQPQLVELQQNSGELHRNAKGNILRAAINPVASSKQTIEVPGSHAKVRSHILLPSIYVNEQQEQEEPAPSPAQSNPGLPWDRFRIVHMQSKRGNRVVGDIKVSIVGKASQEQKFVTTKAEQLTGGWVKITPDAPLVAGEYALVETLGKDGMNLYIWDFGVDPSAPANANVHRPEASKGLAEPVKNNQPHRQQ
jgi:hypothetical protein